MLVREIWEDQIWEDDKMHTIPTHACNCKLRGESSVLSQNSELSSELTANTKSPETKEEEKVMKKRNESVQCNTHGPLIESKQSEKVPSAYGWR